MLPEGELHHAYLLEAKNPSILEELIRSIENRFLISSKANPDFIILNRDTLGIEDSHLIIHLQSQKSQKGIKIIVISASGITREAQNALLKVFEEPTPGTHFFLLIPALSNILPTLISRTELLKGEISDPKSEAKKFISLSIPERFLWLEELMEHPDEEGERAEKQNKIINLLDGLEVYISETKSDKKIQAAGAVFQTRKYLHDTSMSPKLILGTLAVSLPEV